MSIGILALQGGYAAHAKMLHRLNIPWHFVRNARELESATGLIIPGGESSSALKLLEDDLLTAIKTRGRQGLPLFGTCAGAILLAKEVRFPSQDSLGLADVIIERNAYGRQLSSRIAKGKNELTSEVMELIFIRAPRFSQLGPEVKIIVSCDGENVCVRDNNCLLATFHPELTEDPTLHRYFLENMVGLTINDQQTA